MKILHCDGCHAEVNDYAHWYNDKKPRNMYELNCIHESNSDTYHGMIFCHECIAKLLSQSVNIDKIKEAIRVKCERDYMDGDIIADELLEIIDKIVRGEEA